MTAQPPRPLDGITVVAIEQAVAAPFASRHLADLGARVIKIERPGVGDFARGYDTTVSGLASHFVWLNRTKESVTLDLKCPEGRLVLERLVARADVVLHNLAPGALARAGFPPSRLRELQPALIECEVSGYGGDGPYRDRKAYDLLVQGEVGLVSVTGTADAPSKVGISIADIAAGTYAFSGILSALLQRERTGRGQRLEISLFDALSEWMGYPLYYTAYGGTAPARTGASHATIAPYGPYDTRDGGTVLLGIQNEREWTRFCLDVLEQPSLAEDPRFQSNHARVKHRDDLEAHIRPVLADAPFATVVERLDAAGIAHASLNSVDGFIAHPQLEARGRWREIGTPAGTIRALLPPINLEGVVPAMGSVPALGAHTRQVLSELGFDEPTVAAWQQRGVI